MVKKIILTFLILFLAGCSSEQVFGGDELKEWEKTGKEYLKIKAPKNKHLMIDEVDDIRCNDIGDECVNHGKVKKYLYISDKKVNDEKLEKDGKSYSVHKRTRNSVIYKIDKPIEKKEILLGVYNEDIVSTSYVGEDNKEYFVGRFYLGNPFYQEVETGEWYQAEIATTTIKAYEEQTISKIDFILSLISTRINATTITTFEEGYGRTNCWGNNSTNATISWDSCHDATAGTVGVNYGSGIGDVQREIVFSGRGGNGLYAYINRSFFPIDTSTIPSGSSIDSASLNLYVVGIQNTDNDGDDYIQLVEQKQSSVSSLTYSLDALNNGESESLGWGHGNEDDIITGSATYDLSSDITTSAYNAFALNSTGLGWIKTSGETATCGSSETGISCIGIREGHDILDNEIATGANQNNSVTIRWTSYTGTTYDPYLEVTYSEPTVVKEPNASILLFQ